MTTDQHALDDDMYEAVRRNLAAHERIAVAGNGLRAAAVAMTLVADDAQVGCFLLTRRAAGLRSHGGQWALPGGRVDHGETAEQAAVRELWEEVGIADGEILGLLDDYPTRSGYRITPVVVWAAHVKELHPSPSEVAAVYRVPLRELVRPDAPRFVEHAEAAGPVLQMPIFDRLVHAPTAAVLYQFREVALGGRSTRVAHFDQPPFAWR